jgi:hypothetical protein
LILLGALCADGDDDARVHGDWSSAGKTTTLAAVTSARGASVAPAVPIADSRITNSRSKQAIEPLPTASKLEADSAGVNAEGMVEANSELRAPAQDSMVGHDSVRPLCPSLSLPPTLCSLRLFAALTCCNAHNRQTCCNAHNRQTCNAHDRQTLASLSARSGSAGR